jgi:hypothetical protein
MGSGLSRAPGFSKEERYLALLLYRESLNYTSGAACER